MAAKSKAYFAYFDLEHCIASKTPPRLVALPGRDTPQKGIKISGA